MMKVREEELEAVCGKEKGSSCVFVKLASRHGDVLLQDAGTITWK